MNRRITLREMTLCTLFTVLIAIGAFIKIPVPALPITLQTFFVMMAGLLLGAKLGALSCSLYLFLGLAGLPIFTEGGGLWYLMKPSFGYIIGFVIGGYVAGRLAEQAGQPRPSRLLAACFAGLTAIYAVGMVYYYIICNYIIHTPIGLIPLFFYCFLLTVPGDICLCFLAVSLARRLKPVLVTMQK